MNNYIMCGHIDGEGWCIDSDSPHCPVKCLLALQEDPEFQ